MIKFVTVVDSFLYLKSIIVNPALSPPLSNKPPSSNKPALSAEES